MPMGYAAGIARIKTVSSKKRSLDGINFALLTRRHPHHWSKPHLPQMYTDNKPQGLAMFARHLKINRTNLRKLQINWWIQGGWPCCTQSSVIDLINILEERFPKFFGHGAFHKTSLLGLLWWFCGTLELRKVQFGSCCSRAPSTCRLFVFYWTRICQHRKRPWMWWVLFINIKPSTTIPEVGKPASTNFDKATPQSNQTSQSHINSGHLEVKHTSTEQITHLCSSFL